MAYLFRSVDEKRSKNMAAIRSTGMKPELAVRKLVYKLGYRYRLHRAGLPGKPDLAFIGRKKVIFIHGCFWHRHDNPNCKIAHKPRSNLDYWLPKLRRTRVRDKKNLNELQRLGWTALIIWECQIGNKEILVKRIKEFLD